MTVFYARKFWAKATAVAALSLLLTSCFFIPGEFESDLRIEKSGAFAFSYEGEIILLSLAEAARKSGESSEDDVVFQTECLIEDEFEERPCTDEELAARQAEWEADEADRLSGAETRNAAMASTLGGIDPNDPETIEQFIEQLKRQKGWDQVEYSGDGIFKVRYHVEGTLDHDFAFPVIEQMPTMPAFLTISVRQNGAVRVNAPGMANNAAMSGMVDDVPQPKGRFTVRTDGNILTNNTEEGPRADGGWRVLNWSIGAATTTGPQALIAR